MNPMIERIVNRDCCVSLSNRQVIYHVITKLRKKKRTYWAINKKDRKSFMRDCIKAHQENQKLYHQVMIEGI